MRRITIVLMVAGAVLAAGRGSALEFEAAGRPVQIHGFLSQGYLHSDRNNFLADTADGTLDFREYGISAASDLSGRLHAGVQILGRRLGDMGDDEPTLDWAYADYHWRDWMGVRAGRMKLVHGLYNEGRDLDVLRTGIFLPQSVYNESWRDTMKAVNGGGLYGSFGSDALGTLSYQLQYGSGSVSDDEGLAWYIEDQVGVTLSDVDAPEAGALGLQWATPAKGLTVGWTHLASTLYCDATPAPLLALASGIPEGTPMDYEVTVDGNTGSAEWQWREWTLAAEYMRFHTSQQLALDSSGAELMTERGYLEGYYGGAARRFAKWIELGLVYSEYYPSGTDKSGDRLADDLGRPRHGAWLKDLGLTARFDFLEQWVFKVEGHAMNGSAEMFFDDNPPDETEEDWFLFASKLTYCF